MENAGFLLWKRSYYFELFEERVEEQGAGGHFWDEVGLGKREKGGEPVERAV